MTAGGAAGGRTRIALVTGGPEAWSEGDHQLAKQSTGLDAGLIPITVPELLRLLRDAVIPPSRRDQPHRLPHGRWIPDVVPTHGDVIVSEGSGDEVLRGEHARKPVSTNCPPPLKPGPASSCLVTATDRNETMRQGIDARLATLTTLAKAGQASWCSGEDWIQGGA